MTIHKHCRGINTNGSLDVDDYYTKSQINSQMNTKADKNATANNSLSNLSTDGQMIIDSQNGTISNCILEIPQNLNLTLENNVLTVKSGSILTLTGDTYATVTSNHDVARTYNSLADGRYFIFMAGNLNTLGSAREISVVGSGDTVPDSSSSLTAFYNTTNKKMYQKENNVWIVWNVVYPLCIIEASDGAVSFAKDSNGNDMIFNGACFVGHHAVVYPDIKVLIAKGFNPDGSLKSISIKTNSVQVVDISVAKEVFGIKSDNTIDTAAYSSVPYLEINEIPTTNIGSYVYNTRNNLCYRWFNSGGYYVQTDLIYLFKSSKSDSTVTDFTIRQPVRTATVEMLKDKQNDLTTVSGYDATATQTLKHISGVLTWVTEE